MSNQELRNSISSPWDEFRNHPGQVALSKWDLLRDFYQDVVRVNGIQLIMLAELPQVNKKVRKKLFKQALRGGGHDYNSEVTRRLYNYLVSAATLTDHCRYVMDDYKLTDFYEEYRAKVGGFANMPESVFLKDLRNYFAHHKIPSIGLSIGDINPADDFRHEALIYTSDLDDSDRWSARSKKYIDDNFPHVYIAGLVKTHLDAMAELYSWIFSNFERLHIKEYEESLKVKDQILRGQRGSGR